MVMALACSGARPAFSTNFHVAAKCKQVAREGGAVSNYSASVERICVRFGCDPELVGAIVAVESRWNPYAIRYEPAYQWLYQPERYAKMHNTSREAESHFQRYSWGLMQILGATAREIGFNLPMPALCEPMIGLEYGIRYLMVLKRNYLKRDDLIAAYNAGTAKKNAAGRYQNQNYVDKVNRELKRNDQ